MGTDVSGSFKGLKGGYVDQYVVQIRKSKSAKNKDLIFGFLRETVIGGAQSGGIKSATLYDSIEKAENAAATFVLQNPRYVERVQVKKVEDHDWFL